MDYFELFNLPQQLKVNTGELSSRYFELQRKHHPDLFANASATDQAEALEYSSQINRAYKTLKNPDDTIKYVLQLRGLLEEEEKYQLAPAFLMEVLELNEQVMDASTQEDTDRIKASITQLQNKIYAPVEKIVNHYQEAAVSEEELLQVKEYYYRKKYLDRIASELK